MLAVVLFWFVLAKRSKTQTYPLKSQEEILLCWAITRLCWVKLGTIKETNRFGLIGPCVVLTWCLGGDWEWSLGWWRLLLYPGGATAIPWCLLLYPAGGNQILLLSRAATNSSPAAHPKSWKLQNRDISSRYQASSICWRPFVLTSSPLFPIISLLQQTRSCLVWSLDSVNHMLQGVSKKRYFSDFHLFSVLEVGFCFFSCVMESEFCGRFIWSLKLYLFRI